MDVEKTIEFILQQQAKTEAWEARADARWAKADARADAAQALAEARWAKADARAAAAEVKAERQMAAIRKLIQVGMRLSAQNQEQIKELAVAQKETEAAQQVTEIKLQGLIDALRRGRNGRKLN
jgi:hypothetical protein